MSNQNVEPAAMHPSDELVALIGGELDLATLREVVRHVRRCPHCQSELVEVAAGLGALRAVEADGLDDIAEPPPLAVHPLEIAPSADTTSSPPQPRGSRRRLTVVVAAAAAAVVVVLSAGAVVQSRNAVEAPAVSAELVAKGAVDAGGVVTMTDAAGDQVMSVSTTQLPAPPTGSFYEVWLLQPDTGQMLAVGVLPDNRSATFALPADIVANYQAVDVSLQPDNGVIAHSGDSVLRATFA